MASLQRRADSWRVIFRHHGTQHFVTIGEVDETEAQGVKTRYESLLRLINQRLLTLPPGMDIVTFLRNDGKPSDHDPAPAQRAVDFASFRDEYLGTIGNGAVESNTLSTSRIHLAHLKDTLGERFPMADLTHADLQRHVTRRVGSGDVAAITVKKEIDTLRSAWNWARRTGYVKADFPGAGLVYPKSKEPLPFMSWAEIERRVKAGGDPDELWEGLYLTESEIVKFLDFVQGRKAPAWVYPMCVMAAHTGARRFEMLRAERQDIDLETGVITIREKKRVRGKATTRRVLMSSRLKEALAALPAENGRLFGKLSVQAAQKGFRRVVGKHHGRPKAGEDQDSAKAKSRSKWAVLRGELEI